MRLQFWKESLCEKVDLKEANKKVVAATKMEYHPGSPVTVPSTVTVTQDNASSSLELDDDRESLRRGARSLVMMQRMHQPL